MPTGGRGARASSVGNEVIASDPAAVDVGIDAGFSPSPDVLRAPDIAVGVSDQPGWVQGVPSLAVEYADTGQDEAELAAKIQEFLAAGTRLIWVVRLNGPRRVEIHQSGAASRVAHLGDELQAPGILANPVPVEALYDRKAAKKVILRNLLQGEGYNSLDEVRAEGEVETLRTGIVEILTARGLAVDDDLRAALSGTSDREVLRPLLRLAATAVSAADVLALATSPQPLS